MEQKLSMHNFANKVTLITGGTEGIGLAAARQFAQANAKEFVVSRNFEKGVAALHALKNMRREKARG